MVDITTTKSSFKTEQTNQTSARASMDYESELKDDFGDVKSLASVAVVIVDHVVIVVVYVDGITWWQRQHPMSYKCSICHHVKHRPHQGDRRIPPKRVAAYHDPLIRDREPSLLETSFCGDLAKTRFLYVLPVPTDLDDLKDRITTAVNSVDRDMLQRVWEEFSYRLDV